MATVLKGFTFKSRAKVDLSKYTDGKAYKLTKGVDFECEVESVRQAVRQWHKDAPNRESHSSIRDCGPGEVIVQMITLGAVAKKAPKAKADLKPQPETVFENGEVKVAA